MFRTGSDPAAADGGRDKSADARAAGDPSDSDKMGVSSGRGSGSKGGGGGEELDASSGSGVLVGRIGGELDVEAWKEGERPAFVGLDLGLTQRQENYASGTIFQAVLVEAVSALCALSALCVFCFFPCHTAGLCRSLYWGTLGLAGVSAARG